MNHKITERLNTINETDESARAALKDFFTTTNNKKIELLALKLKEKYEFNDLIKPSSDTYYVEKLSLLELAAESNSIVHFKTLLNLHEAQAISVANEDEINACFRALELGHTEIALELISKPHVLEKLISLQIKRPTLLDEVLENKYLTRIQKPENFPIRYNPVKPIGNIALIFAARLADSTLFNELIKNDNLAKQLPQSGIVAFLAATRNNDGTSKDHQTINQEIINQLLKIPNVYKYASKRHFDFQDLLTNYTRQQQKLMESKLLSLKNEDGEDTELDDTYSTNVTTAANSPVPSSFEEGTTSEKTIPKFK